VFVLLLVGFVIGGVAIASGVMDVLLYQKVLFFLSGYFFFAGNSCSFVFSLQDSH
jgi:hypothetical protein